MSKTAKVMTTDAKDVRFPVVLFDPDSTDYCIPCKNQTELTRELKKWAEDCYNSPGIAEIRTDLVIEHTVRKVVRTEKQLKVKARS